MNYRLGVLPIPSWIMPAVPVLYFEDGSYFVNPTPRDHALAAGYMGA